MKVIKFILKRLVPGAWAELADLFSADWESQEELDQLILENFPS